MIDDIRCTIYDIRCAIYDIRFTIYDIRCAIYVVLSNNYKQPVCGRQATTNRQSEYPDLSGCIEDLSLRVPRCNRGVTSVTSSIEMQSRRNERHFECRDEIEV